MKYHELEVAANRKARRSGRGIAAGRGKTAGRGTKGQGARTGKKKGPMFEGGSRPLIKAVPKVRGFKTIRPKAQVVYLDHLNAFADKEVDNFVLFENALIKTPFAKTKVISRGEISKPVILRTQAISKTAEEAIIKAGGSFVATPTPKREAKAAEDK